MYSNKDSRWNAMTTQLLGTQDDLVYFFSLDIYPEPTENKFYHEILIEYSKLTEISNVDKKNVLNQFIWKIDYCKNKPFDCKNENSLLKWWWNKNQMQFKCKFMEIRQI